MSSSKSISKKKQNKILPQRNIQNEYRIALIETLDAFDALCYWRKLSPKVKQQFIEYTIRPPRFIKEEGGGIDDSVIIALRKDIRLILDSNNVTNAHLRKPLPVNRFLTAGLGLRRAIVEIIDYKHPDYRAWRGVVSRFDDIYTTLSNNPMRRVSDHLSNLCYICTDIEKKYYFFDNFLHTATRLENYSCMIYRFRTRPAEKRILSIDNKNRPVYRLGISRRFGVEWVAVQFESDGPEYSVFVQVHALERLKERLTPLQLPDIQIMLFDAFVEPEMVHSKENSYLVAVRYQKAKVGYLVVEIIDSIVVVKTFLFVTQTGTPEGDMFNKAYNLSRFTRQYFELDKLSTFTQTDVYHDEDLKRLFTRCGCGELFTVWEGREKNDISFNKNYASNLKKIFVKELSDVREEPILLNAFVY